MTEKTDWSWRYDPEGGVTKEVPLVTEDGKTVEVEFENERTISKWLNGDFWTQNIFKSGSTAKTGNGQ